ncbi:MAG: PRC-barrel domain-containing protein [Terriglobia bacterium]|jgi:sporulation protein YlmC with PRC-barrel domain|nr:PRC-barrel domain-containing protein [Terriglobia bacterium]
MPHLGTLREYKFQGDTDDIRGAKVHGPDNEVLGDIDDVIFDHDTGQIRYAVIDTGGWLTSKKFLVPADRIQQFKINSDDFYVDLTKEQIRTFPEYDGSLHDSPDQWRDYEDRYRDTWTTEGGILHREIGPNTITPNPDELPPVRGDVSGDFTPERLASTFSDPAPQAGKLRMRPSGTASRAEDTRKPGTSQGTERAGWEEDKAMEREVNQELAESSSNDVVAAENQRWRAFEDNLRRNRVDITASCRSCGPAKDRAA